MNVYIFIQRRIKHLEMQVSCWLIFTLPAFIILVTGIMIRKYFPLLSQLILLFLGWLTWTFIEYIAHRFWMHNKVAQREKPAFSNHLYHHTHPTELKVSDTDRFLLLLTGILILVTSLYLHNYFTLFAGFYFGFLSYTFMHVILHRNWSKTLFPLLLQNHILHHCKFTNKCFGVTVIWWDTIFKTAVPQNYRISEKVISYYFGENHEIKEKETQSRAKLKHKIIYFEWTIRLIRELIWMPIAWVSLKLFKNPAAAKKTNGDKKQEQISKARILN